MELKIISKEPLSLPQVAKMVKGIGNKEERAEVQNKILDFANGHAKMKEAEAEKLRAELGALDIATLSAEHITQIIDILPQDLAELKSVFAGSKTNLSPEQFQKIMEICGKFRK